MHITCSFVSSLPDPKAFQDLMEEYYQVMVDKFSMAGGVAKFTAAGLARDTVENIDALLPPHGRTLLATDAHGRLLGCGALRTIRPDAAELKRMYVRPEARGTGLGKRLFEMRMAEARAMGCTRLYADTVKGNREMLRMYEKMGFSYIPRYPENANDPDMAPYLVFLEYVFP
ncbi:Acetyltransferase (GNAT) family protein [Shimia gijangensis]|uniref:Acetyltransferase (GNAT) family protein n=1 Tax=Shimia gijangensis TaxID=1470563 RepID=A0A1M6M813_9RHOB|nr:GNAT family N-acetyltransferase [Shimia gijangensis]SHJ79628.1 Acetyltransferase (GNAT) family protein [Shimia gijangensis]